MKNKKINEKKWYVYVIYHTVLLTFLTLFRSRTQRTSLSKGYGECVTSIVLCNLNSIDVSIGTLIMSMDKSCYLGFFKIFTPFKK